MKLETVEVDRDGVKVIVNKEDAKGEKLWKEPVKKTASKRQPVKK